MWLLIFEPKMDFFFYASAAKVIIMNHCTFFRWFQFEFCTPITNQAMILYCCYTTNQVYSDYHKVQIVIISWLTSG